VSHGVVHTFVMRLFHRADGRYYAITEPTPDLFGELVITTFHGSVNSRMGGIYDYPADRFSVDQIVRARLRHGYQEVPRME